MNEYQQVSEMEEELDDLMPDGYADGDDFFEPSAWTGSTEEESAPSDESGLGEENSVGNGEGEAAPAIEQPADAETGEAGADGTEVPATEPVVPAEPKPSKIRVKYQFNHQDVEEELDESQLPERMQMARTADLYKERATKAQSVVKQAEAAAKVLGYESPAALINAVVGNAREAERVSLVSKGTPTEIIDDYLARKYPEISEAQVAEEEPEPAPAAPAQAQPVARDLGTEARALLAAYPELVGQKLPAAVTTAWAAGKPLTEAYREYKETQQKAESDALRKENQILKQNAASAAKAPVSGVSRNGSADTKPTDHFVAGFDSDDW